MRCSQTSRKSDRTNTAKQSESPSSNAGALFVDANVWPRSARPNNSGQKDPDIHNCWAEMNVARRFAAEPASLLSLHHC